MKATMEFTYRLTGLGWSEARIADDETTATITASYLSDALGDLLAAVGLLLEGAAGARCSWDEEPGEYRWIFVRDEESVHLRVLGFAELWGGESDDRGATVFETRQPLTTLAAAIADGAAAVLAEHGLAGYVARWAEAPFPSSRLTMIRDQLAAR
jgi:hypothetical protein